MPLLSPPGAPPLAEPSGSERLEATPSRLLLNPARTMRAGIAFDGALGFPSPSAWPDAVPDVELIVKGVAEVAGDALDAIAGRGGETKRHQPLRYG